MVLQEIYLCTGREFRKLVHPSRLRFIMPRLSRRASWKSFRQQDCQEFNGYRAGTMPTHLAGARSLSMPPRSRRAAHVFHSLRDGSCSTREFPGRRAPTTPKRSSVRRKVKRWDGIQRTTTVWDSLRRVSFPSHRDVRDGGSCENFPRRIPSCGFPPVTVSFIFMSRVSRDVALLCEYRSPTFNPTT